MARSNADRGTRKRRGVRRFPSVGSSEYERRHSEAEARITGPSINVGGRELELTKDLGFTMGRRNLEIPPKKVDFSTLLSAYINGTDDMKASAHSRLLALTARDYGEDRAAWQNWYVGNRDRTLFEWRASGLMEAGVDIRLLDSSDLVSVLIANLMHSSRAVREAAYAMLKEIVGPVKPFLPNGSSKVRRQFYRQWYIWWESVRRE